MARPAALILLVCGLLAAASLAEARRPCCTPGKNGCDVCNKQRTRCIKCKGIVYKPDETFSAPYGLTSRGTCVQCKPQGNWPGNCLSCHGDRPKVCTSCNRFTDFNDPIYLTTRGVCAECPNDLESGCVKCADYNGVCVKCEEGYTLVMGKCQRNLV